MAVTLKDVAAHAGVSISAVSQVLRKTGNTWISKATETRVLEAAQELGYRANPAARLLASQKGNYFAIVVSKVKSMIMLDPIRAVAKQAIQAGYTPFVIETSNLPISHYDNVEGLADAVVFIGTGDKEFCQRIGQFHSGSATVVATSPLNTRFPEFIWNEDQGFEIITEHLVKLGHKKLALLGGNGNPERHQLFIDACQTNSLEPLIISSRDETDTVQTGRQMANQLLKKHPDTTAVIGRNFEFTMGALAEFQSLGLKIPKDMSLIAFTDSTLADGIWPRITALKTPIKEAATKAADTALQMLKDKKVTQLQETFPVTLIKGETTAPPRVGTLTPTFQK